MLKQKARQTRIHHASACHTIPKNVPHQTQRRRAQQPSVGKKAFQLTPQTHATAPTTLSSKAAKNKEVATAFQRDGYVLLRNIFSENDIALLNKEMVNLARGNLNHTHNVIGFAPVDPVLDMQLTDEQALAKYHAIEFPHKIFSDQLFSLFLHDKDLISTLRVLIGPTVKLVNSEYVLQSSFNWLQNESMMITRDASLVTALIALDDVNTTVLTHPGSHKSKIVYPTFNNCKHYQQGASSGSETSYDWQSFIKPSTEPVDASPDGMQPIRDVFSELDSMTSVPVEITKGSCLLVSGYTLHRLLPKDEDTLRRVLILHFTSSSTSVTWDTSMNTNSIYQPFLEELAPSMALDVRDIVPIIGNDPYAWKGIHQIFPTFGIRDPRLARSLE